MSDKDRKKKPDPDPPSALNVMPGVEGGHDGLPDAANRNCKASSPPKSPPAKFSTDAYVKGILDSDRTMIGRAITLIESNAQPHQEQAQEVLKALMPHSGKSVRVGITGVPGAGKSTFIETLGTRLTGEGHRVAVMAVDPSSSLTKGSILGDKTRMEELGADPRAFIRPSPSGGTLGGVARKTRETMLVFEAAGYDVLLVETIGVGQSEITVRSMVDFFLLVLIAGAGDELQGLKKGVIEIADAILINKADGDNIRAANLARAEYERALHYLQPVTRGWKTGAFTASSTTGEGIEEIWKVVRRHRDITFANGEFRRRRQEQARDWLHSMVRERLRETFYRNPAISEILPDIEKQVMDGSLPATRAAWHLLEQFEDQMIRDLKKKG